MRRIGRFVEYRIGKPLVIGDLVARRLCLRPRQPRNERSRHLAAAGCLVDRGGPQGIGRDPNLDFVSGQFSKKVIKLENSGMLYFVGDVANGLYRQTAIAVGDGILAAMKIYKFLKEKV